MKTETSSRYLDASISVQTRTGDRNTALDEMTDHAIEGIMSTFTWCAGRQTDVTYSNRRHSNADREFYGRRQGRKAVTQAGLTITRSNSNRTTR
jgi:hypothetical protein